MDIKKQVYQLLSPLQRATAAYLALRRGDETEATKLVGSSQRKDGLGKTFLGLRQALGIYNLLAVQCNMQLQATLEEITAAQFFIKGWKAAGGSSTASSYLKKRKVIDILLPEAASIRAMLNAVQIATKEWANQNDVPEEIFSFPLAVISLPQDPELVVDEDTLTLAREVFGEVKLTW